MALNTAVTIKDHLIFLIKPATLVALNFKYCPTPVKIPMIMATNT
jgi:hypothetical protein